MPGHLAGFSRRQAWATRLAACLLVVTVGVVDYLTGYEFDFYPFYAVPILLTACHGDRSAAVWMVALSALAWWWADAAAGHVYHRAWLRDWSLLMRLVFFLLALVAGRVFNQYRDALRARVELLEKSRRLEGEIIGVSEREQQRVGRDLHDGLCQYLAAVSFTAGWLQRDLAREAHPEAARAGEIMDRLQDAISRAREMARGLSPVDRDEGGLEAALEELAASTSRLTGTRCEFLCPAPVRLVDEARAVHLFRIAQEAVNNAIRHGRARSVIVALEASHGELVLRVSDDGVGFEPGRTACRGMGLNIMRYRSGVAGGALDIYPHAPSGTVVACTLRHPEAANPATPV